MQRIDLQAILSGDLVQGPSRLQQHFVRRPVLNLERRLFILTMIEKPVDFMLSLVQGAAVGDIHFLESAANGQHRYSGGNGPRYQRKRRIIPIWVMQCARLAGRSSVVVRFDIRSATREQESIEHLQSSVDVQSRPQGGNEYR